MSNVIKGVQVVDTKSTSSTNTGAAPVGKMTDITIIAGYQTKDGRQEIVYDIGPEFTIDSFIHSYKEKVAKTKDPETKELLGFEPTGECVLNIKIEFHR